jgi:hypothetical protein
MFFARIYVFYVDVVIVFNCSIGRFVSAMNKLRSSHDD